MQDFLSYLISYIITNRLRLNIYGDWIQDYYYLANNLVYTLFFVVVVVVVLCVQPSSRGGLPYCTRLPPHVHLRRRRRREDSVDCSQSCRAVTWSSSWPRGGTHGAALPGDVTRHAPPHGIMGASDCAAVWSGRAHTHTRARTHTYTHACAHTRTHTLSLSHTHTHTQSLTVTHSLSHSLTHTHTNSHTQRHGHTHRHTQSHIYTHTHSHTYIHTHTHAFLPWASQSPK